MPDTAFRIPKNDRHDGANVIDSYTGLLWCVDGLHLLDADTTYVRPDGKRLCRPCATRKRMAAKRKARRAAR